MMMRDRREMIKVHNETKHETQMQCENNDELPEL